MFGITDYYFLILLAIVVAVDITFLHHYFKIMLKCMQRIVTAFERR